MALMYDMETVNRAMTEAAKLYDPKRPSIRVKRVLDIFAGMKPVEVVKAEPVVHGRWVADMYFDMPVMRCSACESGFAEGHHAERFLYCPNCGAIMDGRR